MSDDGDVAQTALFITNSGPQSLRVLAIEDEMVFGNHLELELIRGLLARSDSCLFLRALSEI